MSKYRYNTLRVGKRALKCFIKQLSQQIYKWKYIIEKKITGTTANQVLLSSLYKQVLERPWNKEGMQLFYVPVLKTSVIGRYLSWQWLFQGKDEINQAVCTANLVLFICCLKQRRNVGRGEDSFSLLLFLLRLVLTWCGALFHLFLTVCVWAVQSHHQSLLCHPPFPFPFSLRSLLPQVFQGSSALGKYPAISPQSTGSLPCRISPSPIPPARGGGGQSGKKWGWGVIWKRQVWEYD